MEQASNKYPFSINSELFHQTVTTVRHDRLTSCVNDEGLCSKKIDDSSETWNLNKSYRSYRSIEVQI